MERKKVKAFSSNTNKKENNMIEFLKDVKNGKYANDKVKPDLRISSYVSNNSQVVYNYGVR
ncbi:MAG: hypothetical protein PHN42_00240 [Bacilli bacterium]|nr:hypothetical protein [Bacilli bacterium]